MLRNRQFDIMASNTTTVQHGKTMSRSNNPKTFLTEEESTNIQNAIAQAESQTSAEIKLVIVRYCWGDIRDKAQKTFHKLNLHKTRQRNAVMIFIVTTNHEFLIFGDKGIHDQVGPDFWLDVRNTLAELFAVDQFGPGLCEAVATIAHQLKEHFPRTTDDQNELSDEVTCID